MPPRMATTLERLRQDLADCLSPDERSAPLADRRRPVARSVLDPVTTVYLFLLQVLHGNTACQHVVHFGGWSFSASAYCQARRRPPWPSGSTCWTGPPALWRATDGARWLGHRVWLLDGSSFSMPDTPTPQPLRPARRPEARVRVPGGPPDGLGRRRDGDALPRPPPRCGPTTRTAQDAPAPGAGGRGRGRPRALLLRPPGSPRRAGRARGVVPTNGSALTSPRAATTCGRSSTSTPVGRPARGGSARRASRTRSSSGTSPGSGPAG